MGGKKITKTQDLTRKKIHSIKDQINASVANLKSSLPIEKGEFEKLAYVFTDLLYDMQTETSFEDDQKPAKAEFIEWLKEKHTDEYNKHQSVLEDPRFDELYERAPAFF